MDTAVRSADKSVVDQNDALRREIIDGLDRAGMDPASLSRQIGRSKDYIREFLSGRKRSIAQDAAVQIRVLLGTSSAAIQAPLEGHRPPPEVLGARDLPVYSAVEGGPGEMVVSTDPIDWVQRPWFLKEVKEGYAVVVTGESMSPAYDPGDIAIVNPRLPAVPGRNAIFVGGEERGEFIATIKRLVRATSAEWQVRQHNPPDGMKADLALPKERWPKALRVVGKYEG